MRSPRVPILLGLVLTVGLVLIGAVAANEHVTTVQEFNPAASEYPEGLAVDTRGNVYVGMAFTGEVRMLAPDGTWSSLAVLNPGANGFLVGLAVDELADVYAALSSFGMPDADEHGVWRIGPDGGKQLVAALPATTLPNGLAFDSQGNLYVTDSLGGAVYRIPRGGTEAEVWVQDFLLVGDPAACEAEGLGGMEMPVGANGIALDARGDVFVANTDTGLIARIPAAPDGTAGEVAVWAGPDCESLAGADGIAFGADQDLYVAVNRQNRVVRMAADGTVDEVAGATDGLDFPASVAFGTGRNGRQQLFLTNFALTSFFAGEAGEPRLITVDVGMPGRPLP